MNRFIRAWSSSALAFALTLGITSLAQAQTATPAAPPAADKPAADKPANDKRDADKPDADNTKTNRRDRDAHAQTADQQKNDKSDVDVTAEIRRAVIADKSLSTLAHNVKIIAKSGMVTLKGPVQTDAEKSTIEEKAVAVVGTANVKNEIEVKK